MKRNVRQLIQSNCVSLEAAIDTLRATALEMDQLREQLGMSAYFNPSADDEPVEVEEEDDDADDEVEQPSFVYAIRARTNVKGKGKSQTVYLRKSPIKTRGWQKWWSESVADASVNLCDSPRQQRMYMEELDTDVTDSIHDLALHKISNPVLEDDRGDSGYIIVDPNPPTMKGTEHYYQGENEDRRDMEWSSRVKDACLFESQVEADEEVKTINREKRKYWGKHSIGLRVKPYVG